MPIETLSKFILLPELILLSHRVWNGHNYYWCGKEVQTEYCPRCANPTMRVYDMRTVEIKDAPIRGHGVTLYIHKKRYWCKTCRSPFTEPIAGIRKGKRHTERYARSVSWACEHFSDLKSVRRAYRCSASFLYKIYYGQLERKVNETLNYEWPTTLGIDEHSFKKDPETRRMAFASMFVDYNNKRVRELVQGKTTAELKAALADIPGRENVKNAVIDMCDPFKNFVRE